MFSDMYVVQPPSPLSVRDLICGACTLATVAAWMAGVPMMASASAP